MSLIESLASCFVLSVGLSSGFAAAVPVWRMYTKTLEQEYLFNRDRYIFEKFQDCPADSIDELRLECISMFSLERFEFVKRGKGLQLVWGSAGDEKHAFITIGDKNE